MEPRSHTPRQPDRRPRLSRFALGLATLAATVVVVMVVYKAGDRGEEPPRPATDGGAGALAPGKQARVERLLARVEANDREAAALIALGDVYFGAGDYGSAGGWMERAVAVEPRNVRARLGLGAALFNLGDRGAAERQWRRAISLDPGNVEAHYDLGFLYLSKRPPDFAAAKRMWRRALRLAPGTPVARTIATHLRGLEKAGAAHAAAGAEGDGR